MSELQQLFTEPKVAVRALTRDIITDYCRDGLERIAQLRPKWDIQIARNKYSVELNRNKCIAEARTKAFDFLILLDDDVQPMDSVVNLPAHNLPVVTGLVPTWRDGFIFWNAFHLKDDKSFLYSTQGRGLNGGLERVYAAGTAIMCIRRDVFRNKDHDPLFDFEKKDDGTLESLFGGEDITFCRKVQKMGHPIYVDHGVQGEHCTKIKLLETLVKGKNHADRDPNHCFPSVFAFDIRGLQIDFAADAYFAYCREQKDAQSKEDRKSLPATPRVSGQKPRLQLQRQSGPDDVRSGRHSYRLERRSGDVQPALAGNSGGGSEG